MIIPREKFCKNCKEVFLQKDARTLFCSTKCSSVFNARSSKNVTRYWLGKKLSKEHIEKFSSAQRGRKVTWSEERKLSFKSKMSGDKNPNYIKDRSKVVEKQERNDTAYKDWRKSVWLRDKFVCRVNKNCCGKIEVHHILSWSEYPDLRYKTNNGITLCHAHHPRVRAEEKRLAPLFMELVTVSN